MSVHSDHISAAEMLSRSQSRDSVDLPSDVLHTPSSSPQMTRVGSSVNLIDSLNTSTTLTRVHSRDDTDFNKTFRQREKTEEHHKLEGGQFPKHRLDIGSVHNLCPVDVVASAPEGDDCIATHTSDGASDVAAAGRLVDDLLAGCALLSPASGYQGDAATPTSSELFISPWGALPSPKTPMTEHDRQIWEWKQSLGPRDKARAFALEASNFYAEKPKLPRRLFGVRDRPPTPFAAWRQDDEVPALAPAPADHSTMNARTLFTEKRRRIHFAERKAGNRGDGQDQ